MRNYFIEMEVIEKLAWGEEQEGRMNILSILLTNRLLYFAQICIEIAEK